MSRNIILLLREIPCIFFLSFSFIYFACMYVSVHATAYIWKSEKNLGNGFSPTRWVSGIETQSIRHRHRHPYPLSHFTGPNPVYFYDPWQLSQESQTALTATTGFCLFAFFWCYWSLNLESSTLEAKGSAAELQPQLFIPTLDLRQ